MVVLRLGVNTVGWGRNTLLLHDSAVVPSGLDKDICVKKVPDLSLEADSC